MTKKRRNEFIGEFIHITNYRIQITVNGGSKMTKSGAVRLAIGAVLIGITGVLIGVTGVLIMNNKAYKAELEQLKLEKQNSIEKQNVVDTEEDKASEDSVEDEVNKEAIDENHQVKQDTENQVEKASTSNDEPIEYKALDDLDKVIADLEYTEINNNEFKSVATMYLAGEIDAGYTDMQWDMVVNDARSIMDVIENYLDNGYPRKVREQTTVSFSGIDDSLKSIYDSARSFIYECENTYVGNAGDDGYFETTSKNAFLQFDYIVYQELEKIKSLSITAGNDC